MLRGPAKGLATISCALLLGLPSASADAWRQRIVFGTAPSAAAAVAQIMQARAGGARIDAEITMPERAGRIEVTVEPEDAEALVAALLAEGGLRVHAAPDLFADLDTECPDRLPAGALCLMDRDTPPRPHLLEAEPLLKGPAEQAEAITDASGRPGLSLKLGPDAAAVFCEVTQAHIGRVLALVLEGQVLMAPRVAEPICGGAVVISGNFSEAETQRIAAQIAAAPYPAPVEYLENDRVPAPAPEGGWSNLLDGLKTLQAE